MIRAETMDRSEEPLQQRPVEGDARTPQPSGSKKVCIVGASGKLGQYMVQHALDRGYEVVGVCRESSVGKLDAFKDASPWRSEEHTSELQSQFHLVCRLLLEKKKKKKNK